MGSVGRGDYFGGEIYKIQGDNDFYVVCVVFEVFFVYLFGNIQ